MWLYFSIPVIFIVLGCIIWGVASKPKVAEFGRMAALAGLIGLFLTVGQHYFPRLR